MAIIVDSNLSKEIKVFLETLGAKVSENDLYFYSNKLKKITIYLESLGIEYKVIA